MVECKEDVPQEFKIYQANDCAELEMNSSGRPFATMFLWWKGQTGCEHRRRPPGAQVLGQVLSSPDGDVVAYGDLRYATAERFEAPSLCRGFSLLASASLLVTRELLLVARS